MFYFPDLDACSLVKAEKNTGVFSYFVSCAACKLPNTTRPDSPAEVCVKEIGKLANTMGFVRYCWLLSMPPNYLFGMALSCRGSFTNRAFKQGSSGL